MTDPVPTDRLDPRRMRVLGWLILAGPLVLAAALAYWQLLRSDQLADRARRQAERQLVIPARRGSIFDRQGRTLAAEPSPADSTDPMPSTRSRFDDLQRSYPQGRTASHLIGRVRRDILVLQSGRADSGGRRPRYAALVGDSGIERAFDARLRGNPGVIAAHVDALGEISGNPAWLSRPEPGADVVLSLDLALQAAAERALDAVQGSSRGAAVAIDVGTGEVLALASRPDFNLQDVSPAMSSATKRQMDESGAWLNRAYQGLYPPGSTFKIVTFLAGLRAGTLRPETVLQCSGFLDLGARRFPCHNPEGHGALTLREALAHSCNVFACRVALGCGADAVATEARRFHLDRRTGIELPHEPAGMSVPDPAQAIARKTRWTDGDTANLSIGQGSLLLSPLQAACMMASLARREMLTIPTLLRSPGRAPTGSFAREPLGISDGDYKAVLDGLEAVVMTGIGRDAQVPGLRIAGKSGTAQESRGGATFNVAWFLAFAPVESPRVAIAVALEGDAPDKEYAGAAHAAPVVRAIAAAWRDELGI